MTSAYISHASFSEHDYPRHPEHAGRIKAVWQQLQGLLEQLLPLAPAPASDEQILAVHSAAHLRPLTAIASQKRRAFIDADTYALPQSLAIARLAAGAVIAGVEAVLDGTADNALALVRPPGHHATRDQPMGFCLLNNIAIGARHAQAKFSCERILILDYDVHHGNGTQDIFYTDGSVQFISIHQSPLYPGSGALREMGAGAGQGRTINVPLPAGCGDAAYRRIMAEIVAPAIESFKPDIMLVSVGFDAHWMDPLAQMRLSLAGYDELARACLQLAQQVCDGKIVFVMEGGYDLAALAHGWSNIARACLRLGGLSDPYGAAPRVSAPPDIGAIIDAVRRWHQL